MVRKSEFRGNAAALFLLFLALLALHASLLRLPYFWDEAGYYVPAARDLLLSGSLIPQSSISNAHPPLVMAYLALAWKVFGFAPIVTRTAMLLMAAFSLLGIFRLAERVANTETALASVACTALYPVFFTQSSLAQVDLAAAGFTFWGFLAHVEERRWRTALWFSLAVLAKETAILAPLALFGWCVVSTPKSGKVWHAFPLLFPLIPLMLWYAFHYARTGYVFGNPEFFRYNVQDTLHPLRIVLALGLRIWQTVGNLNLFVLTAAALLAMWLPPLRDREQERPRIALDTQYAFLAVILGYVGAMSVIGGAVLARYMLPTIPLVIIVCVSTLRRRVRFWPVLIAVVLLGFVATLVFNPAYGISFEDNLSYRDYVLLHEDAEHFIESHYPMVQVLTAWPASDELSRPYLGYVTRPVRVVRIENFSLEPLMAAADSPANFDIALVFSTKYQPHTWFDRWSTWERWKRDYFGFHRDAQAPLAAQILGGGVVYSEGRKGQWVAVIAIARVQEARAGASARPRTTYALPPANF